ncbi:MAG: hydrolase, partial [Maribacter sp.]|nr:hydrolase [Maribacter sp.]
MKSLCALVLFISFFYCFAQDQHKSFTVKYITNTQIKPDGVLDEAIWESAESAHDFWEYFPSDSIQAVKQSDIKMLVDDKNLYIGITVYTAGRNYA